MNNLIVLLLVLFWHVFVTGCVALNKNSSTTVRVAHDPMIAVYCHQPVAVDGKLNDAVWKRAPVYKTNLSLDKVASGTRLQEEGNVQFAWDDQNFYAALDFNDSDIVAEGKTNQILHFEFGDVGELFLKPDDFTWYWELYVTPKSMKTNIWFPGRGRVLIPSDLEYTCGLKVATQCNGTLNNWRDKDKGWTAEMAMPIRDLTARGESFGPGSNWRIFIGRYNYSRYLNNIGAELSSTPQLSTTNYHLLEEYATLVFEK